MRTEFVTFEDNSPFFSAIFGGVTGASPDDTPVPMVNQDVADPAVDAVVRAATSRSVLLARKYGRGGVDREEASRLEILTERLRRLSPRVELAEIDVLTGMVNDMEALSSQLAVMRAKYSKL